MTGPLAGVRVVELASIGPGPFCVMVLADLGADVIRIERVAAAAPRSNPPPDPLQRGRAASIAVDLKTVEGVELLMRLIETADVLVEGFRPGVMERLGAGPETCLRRNERLVYGRMTGWGQEGPRAETAGHDIDYLAIAGALHPIGDADRPPPPPLNLVADFGGGGMLLAVGICAALVARGASGTGQVVDAAMVDGAALLTAMIHGWMAEGAWSTARGANLLDGGAPFYRVYDAADGLVAVGALEPKFYAELLRGLGLEDADLPQQYDRDGWPLLRERFAAVFRTGTRADWENVFSGSDACVAAVNDLAEAPDDVHLAARRTFLELGGVVQPAPAPRFSGDIPRQPSTPRPPGADTDRVLADLGYDADEIAALRANATVA
ncbi:MAG: CaiB/BaiF CoA transferase family protein [Gaiellales bacterium]